MSQKDKAPGWKRLEAIRKQAGLPQYKVELDAGIGIGNLGKYESGERNPERHTLERILDALDAKFTDRVEVLERFGYTMNTPPPTAEEVAWAVAICKPVMDELSFPVYMLDMQGFVLYWNYYMPKMLGMRETQMETVFHRERLTLYQAFFHSGVRLANLMNHPDAFLSHTIRVLRQDWEWGSFLEEDWCQELLKATSTKYPEFKKYWDMAADHPVADLPARPLANLQVKSPIMGNVEFRVARETMNRDKRFRVIYLIPADAATLEQCQKWHLSADERRSQ